MRIDHRNRIEGLVELCIAKHFVFSGHLPDGLALANVSLMSFLGIRFQTMIIVKRIAPSDGFSRDVPDSLQLSHPCRASQLDCLGATYLAYVGFTKSGYQKGTLRPKPVRQRWRPASEQHQRVPHLSHQCFARPRWPIPGRRSAGL